MTYVQVSSLHSEHQLANGGKGRALEAQLAIEQEDACKDSWHPLCSALLLTSFIVPAQSFFLLDSRIITFLL